MPYDPTAPTEAELSKTYIMPWIGFAASLVMVSANILPIKGIIQGFAALLVGVYFVTFMWSSRFDDYFVSLRNFGACCAVLVIGLWFSALGLVTLVEFSQNVGEALSSGGEGVSNPSFVLPEFVNNGFALAGAASLAFFGGFLGRHLRESL